MEVHRRPDDGNRRGRLLNCESYAGAHAEHAKPAPSRNVFVKDKKSSECIDDEAEGGGGNRNGELGD
jgi:hypothetical protein